MKFVNFHAISPLSGLFMVLYGLILGKNRN
nr:MAG TPA: hypothetical protein [Bacteriophage sp.]